MSCRANPGSLDIRLLVSVLLVAHSVCLSVQATRSIVVTINNFAGEGLGPLTCAHLRLTDVTAADEAQHKPCGWFRFPSPAGSHKDRPTVVMAKLYKVRNVATVDPSEISPLLWVPEWYSM